MFETLHKFDFYTSQMTAFICALKFLLSCLRCVFSILWSFIILGFWVRFKCQYISFYNCSLYVHELNFVIYRISCIPLFTAVQMQVPAWLSLHVSQCFSTGKALIISGNQLTQRPKNFFNLWKRCQKNSAQLMWWFVFAIHFNTFLICGSTVVCVLM